MRQRDQSSLEERVAMLEAQVRQLVSDRRAQPGPRDWLATVGMFSGDEYMRQIDESTLKIREEDRRHSRRRGSKRRRAKS